MAVDKLTGELVWRSGLDERIFSRPAEFEGIIYARALDETVYAFSAQSGEVLGSIPLGSTKVFTPWYEAQAGVYATSRGIIFNSRHEVLVYGIHP